MNVAEKQRLGLLIACFQGMGRWRRICIALVLGVLIGLGQGNGSFTALLSVTGLTAAFLTPHQSPAKSAAWFGWALGVGYFGFVMRWIVEPFFVEPLIHGWMAPFAIVAMAGGLALFWAAAFWAAATFCTGRTRFWALAVALVLAEYARSHVLSGLPWGLLSYSLIGGPLDYLFAWVGPHGSTLAITAFAALFACAVLSPRPVPIAALAIVAGVLLAGNAGLPSAPESQTQTIIRLVQPNAPQHQKWDPEWMPVFFQRSLDLTAAEPSADLVIWPETSVPALLHYADPWLEQMGQAAAGAPVIAGLQRRNAQGGYHNSLAVIEPDGTLDALYDKRHLVPFGEYVPLAWVLGRIGLTGVADLAQGFEPGTRDGTITLPGLGRVRVLICYEGIFPEEIIEDGPRPDLLLILTNDAWFGTGPGPRQHLTQARARALEQGLPVLRVANTGISASIDARGNVVSALPLGQTGYLDVTPLPPAPPTFYARFKGGPFWVLLIMITAIAVLFTKIDPEPFRE